MRLVSNRTVARILHALPRERITRLVGRVAERPVPAPVLQPFLALYVRAYGVDLSEALVPPGGFTSFNDFFTRRLREGLRSFDRDPNVVLSPADGRLDDEGPISDGARFVVKGQPYDVATLLGDTDEARVFEGGRYAVVYLSPRDYHRVHSPVEGTVRRVRHLPGSLYPVNAIGVEHVPSLFARNERVVVHLDAPRFGPVAVVLVGAFIVGKIALAFEGPARPEHRGPPTERRYTDADAPRLNRGDELGAFLLGSTVVLLLPPGPWREDLRAPKGSVRVGQPIAWRHE